MSRSRRPRKRRMPGDGCWLCDFRARVRKWRERLWSDQHKGKAEDT